MTNNESFRKHIKNPVVYDEISEVCKKSEFLDFFSISLSRGGVKVDSDLKIDIEQFLIQDEELLFRNHREAELFVKRYNKKIEEKSVRVFYDLIELKMSEYSEFRYEYSSLDYYGSLTKLFIDRISMRELGHCSRLLKRHLENYVDSLAGVSSRSIMEVVEILGKRLIHISLSEERIAPIEELISYLDTNFDVDQILNPRKSEARDKNSLRSFLTKSMCYVSYEEEESLDAILPKNHGKLSTDDISEKHEERDFWELNGKIFFDATSAERGQHRLKEKSHKKTLQVINSMGYAKVLHIEKLEEIKFIFEHNDPDVIISTMYQKCFEIEKEIGINLSNEPMCYAICELIAQRLSGKIYSIMERGLHQEGLIIPIDMAIPMVDHKGIGDEAAAILSKIRTIDFYQMDYGKIYYKTKRGKKIDPFKPSVEGE